MMYNSFAAPVTCLQVNALSMQRCVYASTLARESEQPPHVEEPIMEQPHNPQTSSDTHPEQHLSNVIQTNADYLERVHELISHLVRKAPDTSAGNSTNNVNFTTPPPGYEIDSRSNPNRVILRKKHTVKMADNGKDDVAAEDFEVNISMNSSETTVSMGIPDHAGSGPQPQPGLGS